MILMIGLLGNCRISIITEFPLWHVIQYFHNEMRQSESLKSQCNINSDQRAGSEHGVRCQNEDPAAADIRGLWVGMDGTTIMMAVHNDQQELRSNIDTTFDSSCHVWRCLRVSWLDLECCVCVCFFITSVDFLHASNKLTSRYRYSFHTRYWYVTLCAYTCPSMLACLQITTYIHATQEA